jgi:uncharacterized protein YkwD
MTGTCGRAHKRRAPFALLLMLLLTVVVAAALPAAGFAAGGDGQKAGSSLRLGASGAAPGVIAAATVASSPVRIELLVTTARTAADIRRRWAELKPAFGGSPYAVAPALTAPYGAGSLAAGFLQDGLNAINYARYLAGLPDDVTLDAAYTDRAQHGAVLLAVGSFAHSQAKPADMAQDFFDVANAATSSSNIGWGYPTLGSFNNGCLDDSDASNIDRLGHRRWLLDPPLQMTGMGFADARSDTYVFDWSRAATVDYGAVAWPSAGLFPVEMFSASTAWSITLNPAKYSWTPGGHTVTLRRRADGRVWTFTADDTDKAGEYFNFDTGGYGVADCFIFRPDPAAVTGYKDGDVFDVTLSGGITAASGGGPAEVSYTTEFMSQDAAAGTLPAATVTTP